MKEHENPQDTNKEPEQPEEEKKGFWSKMPTGIKYGSISAGILVSIVLLIMSGISFGVVLGIMIAAGFMLFLLKRFNAWQDDKTEEGLEDKEGKVTGEAIGTGLTQSSKKAKKKLGSGSVDIIDPNDIEVTMDDIAGNEEAKHEVEQVIKFFKKDKQLSKFGGKVPSGVLLFGPPGTGKTMLAKAVAKELGRPFIMPVSSSFAEMWVGVGPKRVRELFDTAKSVAPSVIFIDEIDALGKRSEALSGGDTEHNNTLNEVLKQMDGFATNPEVVIFAATNLLENLDPALLRPGRFDRHIKVDLPDIVARESIFEVHMKEKSRIAGIKYSRMYADDMNLKSLARRTYGCSGADIANIVNESCISAGEEDADDVSIQHFIEAIDRVMTGTKRRNLLSEEERERVAYHETGHALTGYFLPDADNPNHITIVGRDKSLGHTMAAPEREKMLYQDKDLKAMIAVLAGGKMAEAIKYPNTRSTGGGDDYEKANEIAEAMVTQYGMAEDEELQRRIYRSGGNNTEAFTWSDEIKARIDKEINRIIESSEKLAQEALSENWDVVEKFTSHLLDVETMDEDEIKKVIKRALSGGSVKDKVTDTLKSAVKPLRKEK